MGHFVALLSFPVMDVECLSRPSDWNGFHTLIPISVRCLCCHDSTAALSCLVRRDTDSFNACFCAWRGNTVWAYVCLVCCLHVVLRTLFRCACCVFLTKCYVFSARRCSPHTPLIVFLLVQVLGSRFSFLFCVFHKAWGFPCRIGEWGRQEIHAEFETANCATSRAVVLQCN